MSAVGTEDAEIKVSFVENLASSWMLLLLSLLWVRIWLTLHA